MNIPIVDTHLHLWDMERFCYPWLEGQDYLKRTFTIEEFKRDTLGIDIEKMVFVECDIERGQHLDEVAYISGIAEKQDSRISGIVCFAPLEKGEGVRDELETLKKNPLVKGVRRIIQYEEELDFCLREDFIRGVQMLGEYGLTFDICIDYRHNQNIIRFLDKLQGKTKCILDHIGKPGVKEGYYEPWATEIGIMAQFPNLYCKYSSLPSEADWKHWTKNSSGRIPTGFWNALRLTGVFLGGIGLRFSVRQHTGNASIWRWSLQRAHPRRNCGSFSTITRFSFTVCEV